MDESDSNTEDDTSTDTEDDTSTNTDEDDISIDECNEEEYAFKDLIAMTNILLSEKSKKLVNKFKDADNLDTDEAIQKNDLQLRSEYEKTLRTLLANYINLLFQKQDTKLWKSILKNIKKLRQKGFSKDEAIKAAVSYRKYAINALLPQLTMSITDTEESN